MRLLEKEAPKDDPDPKALSCYGLYVPELERTWLRFVDGRPVSAITTRFLEWCCQKLWMAGKKALLFLSGTTPAGTLPKRSGAGSGSITEGSKSAAGAFGSLPVCCQKEVRGSTP